MECFNKFWEMSLEDLRIEHFIVYCKYFLNIKFVYESSDFKIDGFTMKEKNIIWINDTNPERRMNFTHGHEIIHAVFHDAKLAALVTNAKYTEEAELLELEANIGASLLMANDKVIESFLIQRLDFEEMCCRAKMSKNAMQTRLINYLQYNLENDNKHAYNAVYAFRGKKSNTIFEIFENHKGRYKF